MQQLIECVPNFSEGRDMEIIKQITDEIESVKGIQLVDVDPGKATNRTVVTFVGEPKPVMEAAFMAIKKASQLIDMRHHKGAHPRFGATDVCPLVPVSGISMEETAKMANELARRLEKNWRFLPFATKLQPTKRKEKIWPTAGRGIRSPGKKTFIDRMETRLRPRYLESQHGKDRSHSHWCQKLPDCLQCKPQHHFRKTSQLRGFRCSRKRSG